MYAWARVDYTGKYPDDVLIGVGRDDDENWGAEVTLTLENAEYLRAVLEKAIRYARRHQAACQMPGADCPMCVAEGFTEQVQR